MTATSVIYGHKVEFNERGEWIYPDTKELCFPVERECPYCGSLPAKDGHDACLGHLPGVKFACCGHGGMATPYIVFEHPINDNGCCAFYFNDTAEMWGFIDGLGLRPV